MSIELTPEQSYLVRAWLLDDATLQQLKSASVMYFGGKVLRFNDAEKVLAAFEEKYITVLRDEAKPKTNGSPAGRLGYTQEQEICLLHSRVEALIAQRDESYAEAKRRLDRAEAAEAKLRAIKDLLEQTACEAPPWEALG